MNINKKDVLNIIEYLETEKGIKKDIAVSVIKDALFTAIEKSKKVIQLEVHIDKDTGMFLISSLREIVEVAKDKGLQIELKEVIKLIPNANLGEYVRAPIDSSILCRSVAHKAWQILKHRIESKSLEALYKEYQSNVGNIVKGVVIKKIGKKSLLVDIGRMSAVLPQNNYPSNEEYEENDRVSVVLLEEEVVPRYNKSENSVVDDEAKTKIVLSRSCDEFIYGLLANEVPEINSGCINIVGISRMPGLKSKVVVASDDENIDVVGSCIGTRGSRIARISEELVNEKLEIVPYSEDEDEMIRNIFNKSNIAHILKYRKNDKECIDIVSEDDKFPATVGRGGINVKLANKILHKNVKIHRLTAFNLMLDEMKSSILKDSRIVDSVIHKDFFGSLLAENLHNKGYKTWRDLLSQPVAVIVSIDGINMENLYETLMYLEKEK